LGGGCLLLRGAREGREKRKEGEGKGEGKGKGGKGRAGRQGERRERRRSMSLFIYCKGGREGRGEENFTLPPYALASTPTLPPSRKKLAPPMRDGHNFTNSRTA